MENGRLPIFMVVAEGRVVGVEEENSPVSALFLVRLLSLVFFLSTILFVFIAFYK